MEDLGSAVPAVREDRESGGSVRLDVDFLTGWIIIIMTDPESAAPFSRIDATEERSVWKRREKR